MKQMIWTYPEPLSADDARKSVVPVPSLGIACAIAFASAADMETFGNAMEERARLAPGIVDSHLKNGEGPDGYYALPLLPHMHGSTPTRETFIGICRDLPDLQAWFVQAETRMIDVADGEPHTIGKDIIEQTAELSRRKIQERLSL